MKRTYVLLAAICALGMALRFWSLGYGLPAIYYNMDEPPILDRALTFAKGDPNPHNFLYPTLYFYALFAWEGAYLLVGRVLGWFPSVAAFQNAYFVDPSGHFLAARVLGALLGTATIAAGYLLGTRLYGRPVGLGAALFLAVAPLAVRDAHYIKLDVPVTFFATLSLWALAAVQVDHEQATRRHAWLLAGALAGLAISTHYYAAFLAIPFIAAAVSATPDTGGWGSARLLILAGVATLAAFALTSPFFAFEPAAVARDFKELREVDIDRAIRVGFSSSLGTYLALLVQGMTWPLVVFGAGGLVLSLRDWRRGLPAVAFVAAFLFFVSNTFPASRYLNILLPSIAVGAAYALWQLSLRAGPRAPQLMTVLCLIVAVPGTIGSAQWDRFLGMDDTRTLAQRFIEHDVPAGASILVQPYSAPVHQSRDGLIAALRAHLGDEARAPLKNRLQLAATPYPSPAYRVTYVGDSGKGQAPPGDVDKTYISPKIFETTGLAPLRAAAIDYVVTTEYGPAPPVALASLRKDLETEARLLARFSPYRAGTDTATTPVPPFRHNSNSWIDPVLERPGPIVSIWKVSP